MENSINKIKNTESAAPIAFVIGGVGGYFLAKYLEYDKTVSVVSFTLVGAILLSSLTYKFKNK